MSDARPHITTGSRADLQIDCSRCLPIRYSESSCQHCREICPHHAIIIDEQISVDSERCTGCLLCTTACPSGALELSSDFLSCVAQLAKLPEPVLGCCRTADNANATLPCLGGLSDEHLLTLCHRISGRLTLNLTSCSNCPNNAMLPHLKKRLHRLTEAGLTAGGCSIIAAESRTELRFQSETVDRRSFFKSLRSSLFQTAAVVIQSRTEQVERNSSYGEKRVPLRRELLNRIVPNLPEKLRIRCTGYFSHQLSFTPACTTCQGCVAICPTGALTTTDRAHPPTFKQDHCTGCGLCVEFCLDQALLLDTPSDREPQPTHT